MKREMREREIDEERDGRRERWMKREVVNREMDEERDGEQRDG